jgi:tellurite resistance protein
MVEEPEFRISAIVDASPRASAGRGDTRPADAKARWIGPDESAHIAGTDVGGMIYVGPKLGPDRWNSENFPIDPKLPVARPGHGSAEGLNYWPRYESISPANRRAYLEWLAGGRKDPAAATGLVFLFFYGLEYRLFKDGAGRDGDRLVAEVERLLGLYGADPSFREHARAFIEAARLALPRHVPIRPAIHFDSHYGYELPLDVRIWLGRRLADAQALDAEDTLLWLAAMPDRNFRTPVTRCTDEFRALWKLRFAERHPGGLRMSAPKARIKAKYRAASSTFEVALRGPHEDLPDVGAVSAPLKRLRDLVEACTTELEGFSRFVGKHPDLRSGTQAALLLPRDLADAGMAWTAARARAEALLSGRPTALVPLADLFTLAEMPRQPSGRVQQQAMTRLCQILDRVGVAFEPDRRYGGPALDASATVCAFRAPDGAPVDPERPEFLMFRGMIEIACLAAASDGEIAPEEIEAVVDDLRASGASTQAEQARLSAFANSIHLDPPKQQALLKRLAARPLAEREAFARAALAAVMADGRVVPAEIRFLERVHKALLLPHDDIYTAIHRGDPPSRAQTAPGIAAAPASSRENLAMAVRGAVAIDAARLERIRLETQAVSGLLSDIFLEDDAKPAVQDRPGAAPVEERGEAGGASTPGAFPGLDPAHAELLAGLLTLEALDRQAFDREARVRGLLPDGAIETINEWSFDRFGEALLEGDDDFAFAVHLREQLPTAEAA